MVTLMKNLGYYNGKFDEIENMSIPMGDRVCFFGDGVYDATYSRNYKIFALDEKVGVEALYIEKIARKTLAIFSYVTIY